MENEKVKHSGVHDSVSKCEDLGDGAIADVEKKTDNVAVNLTDKNNLPAGAVNEELDVDLDEQNDSVSGPELKTPGPASGDDESVDIIKNLEVDLAKARKFLINMQEHTEKTKSELSTQISDLQSQRDSLLYELEQTTKEVNDSKSIEAALLARVAALESELKMSKVKPEITSSPVVHAEPPVVSETEIGQIDQKFRLDREKQDEKLGTIEQNQKISKTISYPESDVEVDKTIDEQQSQPLVDEPEVSIPEDVDIVETEQVELIRQHEIEPAIETATIHSDEQQQVETELEEFKPKTPEAEAFVMLDVLEEEAKTADFPSLTDKIIFIRALADIRNQDEATRINAVKTIGGIRHEFSVKALIAQMTIEDSAQIRTECIKALAALNMKEAIPAIELALTDEVVAIRLAAVRALYRLAGSEGARTLVRMLSDEDADVRRRTATCISWLGQEDLATELVPLLDDRNISVRRAAVEAMVNLRSRKAVPGLIRHLNDPDKKMRRAINAALESITGKKMGRTFPTDEKSFRCLIARWQQWWNDEYTVIF